MTYPDRMQQIETEVMKVYMIENDVELAAKVAIR